MSATEITVTTSKANEGQDLTANMEDATAKMEFELEKDGKTIILAHNTSSDTKDAKVTVKAGDYWQEDLGDLEVDEISDDEYVVIGPLESARFKDEDGMVQLECEIATSGTLTNLKVAVIELY